MPLEKRPAEMPGAGILDEGENPLAKRHPARRPGLMREEARLWPAVRQRIIETPVTNAWRAFSTDRAVSFGGRQPF